MLKTIGLIEFNSIARGIEAADEMMKSANVKLIMANTICPGKYIVLVAGDVGAVKSSIAAGERIGAQTIVDQLVLPRLHPDIIPAISHTTEINKKNALGVLESFSVAAIIISADTAAKAANVKLIELRLGLGIGGKAFLTLTGDVSDVQQAIKAGSQSLEEKGLLVGKTVISAPHDDLFYSTM